MIWVPDIKGTLGISDSLYFVEISLKYDHPCEFRHTMQLTENSVQN